MSEIEIITKTGTRQFEVTILDIREESYEIETESGTETESGVGCGTELVTLKKGELAYPDPPFYRGIMHWVNGDLNPPEIDFVQAVFLSGVPAGKTGNIALKITLEEGNFNEDTPVATALTPMPPEGPVNLECIRVAKVDGPSLTLKFLSPEVGKVVTYPIIYFLTKDANGDDVIIDPGLGAMRIPPS
ncbi:MAG: hypothetical protein ACJAYF_000958 [Arenicella sp.]|jgi:hypothetical protein